MFDDFFEKNIPENEERLSAESTERIRLSLKSKLQAEKEEEKPMKKKKGIFRSLMIAAAAAITAVVSLISANADYDSDEKYIARINNKSLNTEVTSFDGGIIQLDMIVVELPCEIFLDKDGMPITEDSDVDRRMIFVEGKVPYMTDFDPNDYDPELIEILKSEDGEIHLGEFYGSTHDRYEKDLQRILGLPFKVVVGETDKNGKINMRMEYDEKYLKDFWERYREDPEEIIAEHIEWHEHTVEYNKNRYHGLHGKWDKLLDWLIENHPEEDWHLLRDKW